MIDFATFFAAVHAEAGVTGPEPYPWQAALAHRLATAAPPKAISVPTGGGKTATIDALVWALAQQAGRSPRLRTIGVRTVWAIDRRILVDEVHDHVARLAERLESAASQPSDVLHEVAVALQSLTGDGSPPLVATRWRGGIPVDRRARHPLQPEIITSTVAQVGSRLLFRGYGVGRRSLSLQAALTAVDTTICLDEAHIAEPFRATVESIAAHREREALTLPPLHLVTLTATPGVAWETHQIATIGDADRAALGLRLTGEKIARLVEPDGDREIDRRAALLDAVSAHLANGARSVACVVNSVRTAVEIRRALTARLDHVDVMLLIGPQRPADRARALAEHGHVLFAGGRPDRPLVVVATQTFEVGLDADVEALVTQSASASALVQRLGRCNRRGLRAGHVSIVRDTGSWLYEHEEPAAWTWLRSLERSDGTIDVSVAVLERAPGRPVPTTGSSPPDLSDDIIDRLVQTEPRPAIMDDPDVDVFLRGVDSDPSADVSVLWRCDLHDTNRDMAGYREALLRLAPPQPEECVTLSIGRARGLLAALRASPQARARFAASVLDEPDVEGEAGEVRIPKVEPEREFGYVVLRGGEHLEREPVRPGDVVVLPTWIGGYANDAVDHASSAPVEDVGPEIGGVEHPPFWRVTEQVLRSMGVDHRRAVMDAASAATRASDPGEHQALAGALLDRLRNATGRPTTQNLERLAVRRLTTQLDLFAGDVEDDELDHPGDTDDELSSDDETAAFEERAQENAFVVSIASALPRDALRTGTAGPPTLESHALAVAARVEDYAGRVALTTSLRATLRLAARGHDHGKSDPRTQAFYRGGTAGLGDLVLAKSVFGIADMRADRAARTAAGLPRDLRHEVASVAVVRDAVAHGGVEDMPDQLDVELLLHLVGTHHGLGRPVPRLPQGGASARRYRAKAAGVVGIAAGDGRDGCNEGEWLERFLTVTDRYGAWGSAYLGALLVLADRTVSGEGL